MGGDGVSCAHMNASGSVCVEPVGHEGPHRAHHGFRWTYAEDAAARAHIVKELGGRTE